MNQTYDIIIVGCGPVGATLANLLADFQLKVALFEKELKPYPHPRAIHVDDETLRIFQAIGMMEELKKKIVPFDTMQLLNQQRKVMVAIDVNFHGGKYGYAASNWFYQPDLESLLRQKLKQKSTIDFFEGFEVINVQDLGEFCQVEVKNILNQEVQSFQGQFVIGTDGGKSTVREKMGIQLENLKFDQSWMVVDTFLKSEQDIDLLPLVHQQICDPQQPITYVPGVGLHRRFEFMLTNEKDKDRFLKDEKIGELLSSFITPEKLEIKRATIYTFHGLVAETWRKGRLLLAGDAAHQMPPFAGQGMCSGIRDAHNLAYKLALVLSKQQAISFLDTYQEERKKHTIEIAKGAIFLGKIIQTNHLIKAFLRNKILSVIQKSKFLLKQVSQKAVRKTPYTKGHFGKHKLSGKLFIQPKVQYQNQEVLLDELLGNNFVCICRQKSNSLPKNIQNLNFKTLIIDEDFQDINGELKNWMRKHKVTFVLVRPDRYIFEAEKF